MNNSDLILLAIFLLILLFTIAFSLVGGYMYASYKVKAQMLKQVKEQTENAYQTAQGQFQKWREQELLSIQQHMYDSARGKVIQEMQEQVQQWQRKELLEISKRIQDASRGEALQEAQEQLKKWREQELIALSARLSEESRQAASVQLEQWKTDQEAAIRKDAIQKSQSVTMGKVTEHIVPYLPDFTYNPKDARFIGSPIDLIVFDGLNDGEIRKIVFIEIKTGVSSLTSKERLVRNAIQAKNVEWLEWNPGTKIPHAEAFVK